MGGLFILLISFAFGIQPHKAISNIDLAPKNCDKIDYIQTDALGNLGKKITSDYCFNKSYTSVISRNCKKNCKLIQDAKNSKIAIRYMGQGTPGALFCLQLGGRSEMAIFSFSGEIHQVAICQKDDDVVSVDYLLSLKSH